MKIFLSVGHSILKNGNCTSADGRGSGGVLEYEYCKQLAPYVKKYLEQAGHTVTLVICPEKQFAKSSQEKSYKIPIENKGGFDMACELHLNAYDGSARGCEVLYKSANGKVYAERVNAKLAQYFTDRGVQKRDNLYMLNSTKAPAIIVESFFCDSAADYSKAKAVGMDAIGRAIAEGIANKTIASAPAAPTPAKPSYSVGKTYTLLADALRVRKGAGTNYAKKEYSELSADAQKHAYSSGALKKNTNVTCKEIKTVGSDIWMRIPSGWIAAYYKGKKYVG